jgi:predicted transcriptional regulator
MNSFSEYHKRPYSPRGGLLIRKSHSGYLPKPKRNKMEIYNDILSAIKVELTNGEAKPTRVQSLSNLAYDKLVRYLDELESKKMIMQDPLSITEKGYDFLQDYDRIRDFLSAMNLKYLNFLGSEIYEH